MSEPRKHARYGGSSAYRWMFCPGSVRLTETLAAQGFTREESKWAAEGTKAHDLLAACLDAWTRGHGLSAHDFLGTKNEHYGTYDDPEMLTAVQSAVEYVNFILDLDDNARMVVEQQFIISMNEVVPPGDVAGFNDVAIILPSLRTMYVIDYKHGAGHVVEVENNKQLLFYALGALTTQRQHGLPPPIERVVLVIIQPRAFHPQGPIREWVVTPADLYDFSYDLLDAVIACEASDAPLRPSKDGCRWCPASVTCPALEARAMSTLSETFKDVKDMSTLTLPDPRSLPAARVAYILDGADLIQTWLDEVAEYALEIAKLGHHIPGRKLVEAQHRRKWHGDPEATAQALVALSDFELGYEDVFPRKLITITEAETKLAALASERAARGQKKLAAAKIREATAFLTVKETSGNLVLARDSDKRPAVNPAAQNFAGVKVRSPAEIAADMDRDIPF